MESNREWQHWGAKDPLWAVSSVRGKRRGDPAAWSKEEFVAYGAADWVSIRRQWEHYGLGSHHGRRRVIEIGCGAGRMTGPLLTAFESVLAVDVSQGMLEQARTLLADKANNVEFVLVDDPAIPAARGSCDGVFSTHVFQHLSDPAGVKKYLSLAFEALARGASLCLHFPVSGAHREAQFNRLRLRPHFLWNHMFHAVQFMLRRTGILSHWEYRVFQANDVFRMLNESGYTDLEMRIFDLASMGEAHSFFFARRP